MAQSIVEAVPTRFQEICQHLLRLTDEVCHDHLDEEYAALCRQLAVDICQEGSPVLRGKRESWACGILAAVGWVNFLTDPAQTPHAKTEQIAGWFGVSTATLYNKLSTIRDLLDLTQFDPHYSRQETLKGSPLCGLVEIDGLVVPMAVLPPETQVAVRETQQLEQSQPRLLRRLPTKRVMQFKVTLDESDPPIWRRIQVPDQSLEEMHECLQAAMGWEFAHLHLFVADEVIYEPRPLDKNSRCSHDVFLSDLFPDVEPGGAIGYVYDMGDSWEHIVEFEGDIVGTSSRAAKCLDGRQACPPEDCGGILGYREMLEALADPDDEQHEELMEWIGRFDPDRFDPRQATRRMRRF